MAGVRRREAAAQASVLSPDAHRTPTQRCLIAAFDSMALFDPSWRSIRKARQVHAWSTCCLANLYSSVAMWRGWGKEPMSLPGLSHEMPAVTILVALVGYALVFGFVAVRYFRWE